MAATCGKRVRTTRRRVSHCRSVSVVSQMLRYMVMNLKGALRGPSRFHGPSGYCSCIRRALRVRSAWSDLVRVGVRVRVRVRDRVGVGVGVGNRLRVRVRVGLGVSAGDPGPG